MRPAHPIEPAPPPARQTGPAPEAAIRAQGLRKVYPAANGGLVAVDGLDLTVEQGEFFGLLGSNGAGKSTTIGMLTTLVAPTAGSARVAGREVSADPVGVKYRIGVVSQSNTLDSALTVAENLAFRGRYFGLPAGAARRRAHELLDRFALADKADAKVRHLSGGQARRVMICRALVHRPEVLFLDEPTTGVDPRARDDLWQVLSALHADGQTIVLTTHYLEEAEALCQRLAIMDRGLLLVCDTPDAIKASSGAQTVITVRYHADAAPAARALRRDLLGPHNLDIDGPSVRVRTTRPDGVLAHLLQAGSTAGLTVRDATTVPPSLQTAFITLTGRDYLP